MAVGEQFGRYHLRRKLARGGMADLFLATRRDPEGERLIVIKMMLPTSLRKSRALKLFLGEARLAALLHHENIVEIEELDRVDDYYFIAMEYIPGETLFHLLHQSVRGHRPIRVPEASAMMQQACQGLAYAHSMADPNGQALNLVHRDISLSNLMVSYEGQIKILDFGIAAADTRRVDFPRGKAVGKFGYMSPEQCRGQKVDQRSDIFSLGVVFWELITGANLFPGNDHQAINEAILSGDIPPPTSVRREIPPAIEAVVMRALAKEPRDRFPDARAMGQAIQEAHFDDALASRGDLAVMMVDLFGKRRARLSQLGDIGQELELETLLFDDLIMDGEEGTAEPRIQKRPGDKRLSPTTVWLLAMLIAVLGVAAVGLILARQETAPATKPVRTPTGIMLIDSTPPGAKITIDGYKRGQKTPAEVKDMPIGRWLDLHLTKPGYQQWDGRVMLESEAPRRIHAMLIKRSTVEAGVLPVKDGAR